MKENETKLNIYSIDDQHLNFEYELLFYVCIENFNFIKFDEMLSLKLHAAHNADGM